MVECSTVVLDGNFMFPFVFVLYDYAVFFFFVRILFDRFLSHLFLTPLFCHVFVYFEVYKLSRVRIYIYATFIYYLF